VTNDLTYSTQIPEERDPHSLGIEVDKRSSVPIFVQIQDALKYLIATHKLLPYDRLPSVRKFAKALEINPNTVDKAYMTLEQEGFIRIEKGRGTFVNDGADHLPGEERIRQIDILFRDFINNAFKLGLNPQSIVVEIAHRLPKDEK
jgi:GntR family transcriptional regulator